MKKIRKKSLEKKLAAAMSAIGALNACAPIALPYVNLVGRADSVVPGGFVSVAHAKDVPLNVEEMDDGDEQDVYGGVGSVGTMNGGLQYVEYGTGNVGTMNEGIQYLDYNATGNVDTMNGGTQLVHYGVGKAGTLRDGLQTLMPTSRYYESCGGTLIASVMSGGTQKTAYNATVPSMLSVGTMYGGVQVINWGDGAQNTTGVVDVMSGGTQIAYITFAEGNVATVKTMYGGTQNILGMANRYASATVKTMNGGRQLIDGTFATGVVETMNGGVQEITSGGSGKITHFNGGTQIVSGNCESIDVTVNSGAVLEEHAGATLTNVKYNAGGTHRIVDITSNGYNTSTHTLEVASGAKTSGTIVSSGGTELVTYGGSSTDADIKKGGVQNVRGGEASLANLVSGAQQLVAVGSGSVANLKSGAAQIVKGGVATVGTMDAGGMQIVSGGSGTVTTNNGGTQIAAGGRAFAPNLTGAGGQIISGGVGTAANVSGGGEQFVMGGKGGVSTLGNMGRQTVYSGGSGGVTTLNGGTQVIRDGGKGAVETLAAGKQVIYSGGTGRVSALAGGAIEMYDGAVFKGDLTGYGDVGIFAMRGTVTATGLLTGNRLAAGAVSVRGGNIALTGHLSAQTLYFDTVPATAAPLIRTDGNISAGVADFTGLRSTEAVKEYTLLSAGGAISDMTVTRNGRSATLTAGSSVVGAAAHETLGVKQGLTLGYDTMHTVSLASNRKTMTYRIQTTYTDAAFGTVPWSTAGSYYDVSGYAYNNAANINLANLGFSFSYDAAMALAPGQSMTLLSGLPGSPVISGAAPSSVPVSLDGANTVLSATARGSASVGGGSVSYTMNSITLDKVSVKGIYGGPDVVPAGWTANGFVPVDTDTVSVAPDNLLNRFTLLTGDCAIFSDDLISGQYKYTDKAAFNHERNGVTLGGTWSRGVTAADGGRSLVFVSGELKANSVTLGNMAWGTPRALSGVLNCDFTGASVDATKLAFTNLGVDLAPGSSTDLLTGAKRLAAGTSVAGGNHRQNFAATAGNGVTFGATLDGTVSVAAETVRYTANSVSMNNIRLAGWNYGASNIPDGWTKNPSGLDVNTDGMGIHPEELARRTTNILTGPAGFFSDANLLGENVYKDNAFFSSTRNGVTLSGTWSRGVVAENGGAELNFRGGDVEVDAIALGAIPWEAGASLRPKAGIAAINYSKVSGIDSTNFSVLNPEDAAAGDMITLLNANATLRDIAAETKTAKYSYHPVFGVTVTGGVTGVLEAKDGDVTFVANDNRASNLNFHTVDWTGKTALMVRPENISFDGAQVNTSKITFMNKPTIKKGDVTTLVSDYDGAPGSYEGNLYRIGSTLEGDGRASMDDDDNLIFTAESDPRAAKQTHNVLMGAGAAMVALSTGNDFIGGAIDGLGDSDNEGSDGVAVYAQMGGGSTRQETGSHIDVHGWNAILALGRKNKTEKSAMEYGAFFEYGNGNYTTHNDDLRGDGSVKYTGGGLLAKWTAKHGLYVEGSLRAGSIHGETNGVLRDVFDNPYHYEIDTPYWGLHLGVGREIALSNGDAVDVYGKYFFNRRSSTSFNVDGQYNLDALTSQILRVGARYTMKRDEWKFYGGLACEYELDGKATGTVDGFAIRATDPSGASLRAELGAKLSPDNSPWSLDLNLAGFAGKKRGLSGGVGVAFMF
ncbi:MAG: hypothetical protein J6Z82_00710 [Schwartzia sp.]|nr:hypothetical protein [Schwartzia sp. (in: firmicutes)]